MIKWNSKIFLYHRSIHKWLLHWFTSVSRLFTEEVSFWLRYCDSRRPLVQIPSLAGQGHKYTCPPPTDKPILVGLHSPDKLSPSSKQKPCCYHQWRGLRKKMLGEEFRNGSGRTGKERKCWEHQSQSHRSWHREMSCWHPSAKMENYRFSESL